MLPLIHVEGYFLAVFVREFLINLNCLMRIIRLTDTNFPSAIVDVRNKVIEDASRIFNAHVVSINKMERTLILTLINLLNRHTRFIIQTLHVGWQPAESHRRPNSLPRGFSTDFEGLNRRFKLWPGWGWQHILP